ncbi:MAG TPA: DegV family protein [Mycobacteriales bacterium]|jgi:DegV family protein with EDD domain|nr:DegV family protein [Mycobacteriales bacterium]
MGGRVVVVTDSTAYLPTGLADELSVRVVPLQVVLGGRSGAEGSEVTPAQVAAALAAWVPVSTSRPTPTEFAAVYREALEGGACGVVSLHLSRELSGTWDSARLAAGEVGADSIRVVDSRSAAMGLGFAVLAAAKAAAAGGSPEEVYAAAVGTAERTTTLFYVDTLEHLRRGGRIGAAQALLGTALSVKPILHVREGRIVPLEKVRTVSKGIARLEALAVAAAGDGPADVAVHHLAAAERAALLAERLRTRLPQVGQFYASEVGAVVGAHVGPGVLGVVVVRH